MPKEMLINVVNEEESRIAIVSDRLLEELSIETASQEQIEGNIYKAKIVKIIPSLEAVFVDYGRDRNGFLAYQDIRPHYFGNGGRGSEGLRKGQELMVQARKGEMGQKGAALTTYVSIPGRYIVLMPFVSKRGVSRKIQDEDKRRELKKLLQEAGVPDDMGYIIRTAGLDQTKQDLSRDASYLLRLWKKIQSQCDGGKAPSLLYQESDIVIRTIRDYFSPAVQEVWIDNKTIFEQVHSFFRAVMPWYQKRLHLYQDRAPLFNRFNLESQIASIYDKTVPLPSGGSVIIEQTEALVSVDVNSGKTTKGKDIDETAFIANREAAEEVARQLRLRDLGGLIVIDFIDMKSSTRRTEVRKVLQKALKEDKARTDVGTISKFGMLELSRQRIKPAGLRIAGTCPACGGSGKVRSAESLTLSVLRTIQSELARSGRVSQVLVGLPTDAAVLMLNRKRRALQDLETDFACTIAVFAEQGLQPTQYYGEFRGSGAPRIVTNLPEEFPRASLKAAAGLPGVVARSPRPSLYALLGEPEEEIPEVPEEPPEEVASEPTVGVQPPPGEGAEKPGKKRKRRRKKKKLPAAEAAPPEESAEPTPPPLAPPLQPELDVTPAAILPAEEEASEGTSQEPSGVKKLSPSAKRRLRRRRKKAQAGGQAPAVETGEGAEGPAQAEPEAFLVPAAEIETRETAEVKEEAPPSSEKVPKKSASRRRRAGRPKPEGPVAPGAAEAVPPQALEPSPLGDPQPSESPQKKPRRPGRRRKKPEAAHPAEPIE